MVHQREIGADSESAERALMSVLREDPDVILIGEVRTHAEISLAMTLAETGHLVLTTVHAHNAAGVVDRLVDVFPNDQQNQIRAQLAQSLRGVICQMLIEDISEPRKRHLAAEVMFTNDAIRTSIRDEGRSAKINDAVIGGRSEGMVAFDWALAQLVADSKVGRDEARKYATTKDTFEDFLLAENRTPRVVEVR
jgi:twitching motility protein PilT